MDIPTAEEIKAAVPPQGIKIAELIAMFKSRVRKERSKDFVAAVKTVAHTRNVEGKGALLFLK